MSSDPLKRSFNKPTNEEVDDFVKAAGGGDKKAVMAFLSKYPAAIDSKDIYRNGDTALLFAAWAGKAEIVALLLKRGADVNIKNDGDNTPLMGAAGARPTDGTRIIMVDLLLEKGAAINEKNQSGKTALMMAALYGCMENVPLLLERGTDIDAKDRDEKTAIDIAEEGGYYEIVELLQKEQKRCEREKWLADTDFSTGLKKAIPATRPLKLPAKGR